MSTWVVILTKKAGKNLKKLPKEIIEILDQFRRDLEAEGPTTKRLGCKTCARFTGMLQRSIKT